MNSITFVLLLTVLGCAFAQQTDLKQQVLAVMDGRGISMTLRDMDEECRSITRELLGSCIAYLYSDYTLEQLPSYLFTTNPFGDFALSWAEFSPGFTDLIVYPDRTLKRNGCCQLLCQISKHSCSCGEGNVSGLYRVFTNGGFYNPALEFLRKMKEVCENEDIFFQYDLRYRGWWGCFIGRNEWYYSNTDCS